jgi:hypothetical protein
LQFSDDFDLTTVAITFHKFLQTWLINTFLERLRQSIELDRINDANVARYLGANSLNRERSNIRSACKFDNFLDRVTVLGGESTIRRQNGESRFGIEVFEIGGNIAPALIIRHATQPRADLLSTHLADQIVLKSSHQYAVG